MNVRSLGYVVIETTDLQQWRVFGSEVVGMMAVSGAPGDANLYLKMDARPWRFAVRPGETDRLLLCGWELQDQADFERARQELIDAGVELTEGSREECRMRRVQDLLRFQDPAGNSLEVYWGGELDYATFVSPVGLAGFMTGFNGDMGLGHAVLPAPNLAETHAFYRDVMGFGDTDYMHFHFSEDPGDPGQGLNFMHVQNPRHHSLALYQAEMPAGCVHLMVEVPAIDDVGYCLDRVLQHGIPVTSTLGRHSNDRMLSFYMATPSGFSLEFGCDGLQVDWTSYTPTRSTLPSLWGHEFQMPD
jgi:3,4-dihydroxy-9,10-secoandrosta-1,3,5(10)-triene-9,17-dione 4,5-dioxygenase